MVWDLGIGEKVVWWVVCQYANTLAIEIFPLMTFAAPVPRFAIQEGASAVHDADSREPARSDLSNAIERKTFSDDLPFY